MIRSRDENDVAETAQQVGAPDHGSSRSEADDAARRQQSAEHPEAQTRRPVEIRAGHTEGVRDQLFAGSSVEVAGYELAPAMARALHEAEFTLPASYQRVIVVLEVASQEAGLSPASEVRFARLEESGCRVKFRVVRGSPFWQTVEITECRALIEATRLLLSQQST